MPRSEIDTIKYNAWPRTPHEKETTRKHHIQESEETRPFSAGAHKAAMNRHDNITAIKHK